MANISRAERLRREEAARKIVEANEALEKSRGKATVTPGVIAHPLQEIAPNYVPIPPEPVKTKYQLGREAYEKKNPEGDFGKLTYEEQAVWIAEAEAVWNAPKPAPPPPAPVPPPAEEDDEPEGEAEETTTT